MKKLIAMLLTISAFQVQAEESTPLEFCTVVSQTAQSIAEARFNGLPMSKALEIVEESEAITTVVMMAYDLPAYRTPEMQRQEATELANRVMKICLKAVKD